MKYKLVAVDLDGTLVTDEKKLTENTIRAIRQLIAAGVKVVVATGRPIRGVDPISSLLHLTGPAITYNGAAIVDTCTHEILYERGLRREDAKKVFDIGLAYDTTMCIWAGNQLYGNKINDRIMDYRRNSGVEPIRLTDIEKILDIGITKYLWYDDAAKIQQMTREISADLFSEVTFCTSTPYFLEFFHQDVSKGNALKQVGQAYHIPKEEMVAIGDGVNYPPPKGSGLVTAQS